MYQAFLNFLRGSVLLGIECPMPERLFNLCAAHDIPFWDVRWSGAHTFTLRTTRWGHLRLKSVTRELDLHMTVRREKGVPLLLYRFRRRYVLLGAALLFVLLFWWGNTYIWDIEIHGNDTVPTEQILRALERQGVKVGTRSLSIDQEDLRNHILLELKDVSWLAVNISGCTAHVQVVERHRPPELLKDNETCNVVAAKDGLILRVEALDGKAAVIPGSTVSRGQLLISGVVDSDRSGVRLLHGMGRVYARTWYDLSTTVPLSTVQHGEISRTRTRFSLIFGKRRINFFSKGSVLPPDCDKITLYRPLSLPFGFHLPVTLAVEKFSTYSLTAASRSIADARQEGEQTLLRELQTLLLPDGTVESTRFAAVENGSALTITLNAACCEQIGQSIPLGSLTS